MPPDFSDVEYWNARFVTEDRPFEWLKDPGDLLPHLRKIISTIPEDFQKILHIGPGSSTLSLSLRSLVSSPDKIHNVDYSQNVIDLGINMEKEVFGSDPANFMHWSCLNLLDGNDVHTVMLEELFEPRITVIVDKSATDSIACGPDVTFNRQAFRTMTDDTPGAVDGQGLDETERSVHPVTLLALHMAVLTPPDAHWVCLSYSNERFPFWLNRGNHDHTGEILQPAAFWILETLEPMRSREVNSTTTDNHPYVHRPPIDNWLYVLRRTSAKLDLTRGAM